MRRIALSALLMMLVSSPVVFGSEFDLSSPDLNDGETLKTEQVFNGFGCQGDNISPELHLSHPPSGTKSYAVTVYDPDAPTGSGWWHWVLFNIPAKIDVIAKDAGNPASGRAPEGSVQSRNDFGNPGYGGACPPVGNSPHRYEFSVYALDVEKLDLGQEADIASVALAIERHSIAKATITVHYGR